LAQAGISARGSSTPKYIVTTAHVMQRSERTNFVETVDQFRKQWVESTLLVNYHQMQLLAFSLGHLRGQTAVSY